MISNFTLVKAFKSSHFVIRYFSFVCDVTLKITTHIYIHCVNFITYRNISFLMNPVKDSASNFFFLSCPFALFFYANLSHFGLHVLLLYWRKIF